MVAVDDPAVGEVSGQVLVLDGLDQAQLSDRPKYNNYSLCPCVPLQWGRNNDITLFNDTWSRKKFVSIEIVQLA